MRKAIAYLSRRYHFSASHRLHAETLTAEQNRDTFGKCNNPFGHGHNYVVEVTYSGPVDATTGMVTSLADLDSFAQIHVVNLFDHANLDTLNLFCDQVSTTENLCIETWRIFSRYQSATLRRVRIEETGNNSFDYYGEGASVPHLD